MYETWYSEHYHEMSDAGRWFDGRGINVLPPSAWDERPYRVLIVRLSTARDTADSFTHQLLYQIAASCDGVFADCAWLPPPEDAILFDRGKIPWLTGVATKRPALDFDCIAISNSIVQELINLPTILIKSGIPLGKRSRISRADIPLVIMGGANALFTSVLLGDDPPVDAVFTGEDEALIGNIFIAGQKGKRGGIDKREVLDNLVDIPGMVEPDRPNRTSKHSFPLSPGRQLLNAPVFSGQGDFGTASLQISAGCPCFCTFCAENWSRKPYREADTAAAVDSALAMKASMGLDRIDIYSFNFNMHSGLKDLIAELCGLFSALGFKSQRIDGIADDPELLPILHAVNKSSITVGIEGISKRMRSRLQKGLDEHKLQLGLTRLMQAPIRELKLFFLATGREDESDIDEFRSLLVFITEAMQRASRFPRIIISMTPLVRFPFTPLEREDAADGAIVRQIILQCERLVNAKRFEFRSAASMHEYHFSQMFVRASDPRQWIALCDAVAETGFVYYRDIPDAFMETLYKRLLAAGLTREALLRASGTFERMPVQLPVDDACMNTIKLSSEACKNIGYCLGSYDAAGRCRGCNACADEGQRSRMTAKRPRHPLKGPALKALVQKSNRTVPVFITCSIPASQRGLSRGLMAAEMARVFMAESPLLLRSYRGCDKSLVAGVCESEWIHGEDLTALRFQEDAGAKLKELCGNKKFLAKLNDALEKKVVVSAITPETPASRSLMLRIAGPWECDPARYCREYVLKHVAQRSSDGWMRYQLTKDALKKRLLQSMEARREGPEWVVEIVPGEKFVYNGFIRSVVALPTERHIARVLCEARIGNRHSSKMTRP